jgi:hypothetical protein
MIHIVYRRLIQERKKRLCRHEFRTHDSSLSILVEEKQAPTLHYLFNPWRRITAREHTHQQPIAMTPFFATKKMLVKVAFHLDFYIT